MKKRIISLLTTLILLCNLLCVTVYAETTPAITVSSVTAIAGEEVDVTISIENNPGIVSVLLTMEYDSEYLELKKATDKGNLGTAVFGNNLTTIPYKMNWNDDTASENMTYSGELATLTFKVKEGTPAGSYPIEIACPEGESYDVNLDPVEFATNSGSIILNADDPEPDPEPDLLTVVDMEMTMDDASTGLLYGSNVSSVTYADGIATSVHTGVGNNGMVGVKLVDIYDRPYNLKAGDSVEYEVKLHSTNAFVSGGLMGGLMMRAGGVNYPPSDPIFSRIHTYADVDADTWVTLAGTWTCNNDYTYACSYLNIRPEVATTLKVDYINIIVRSTEELPEYIPDDPEPEEPEQPGGGGSGGDDIIGDDVATVTLVDIKKTMDDEETGLLGGSDTSITYADGIATAVLKGNGNNAMVGIKIVDANGAAYSVKKGDVISYKVKLNPTVAFATEYGTSMLKGLFIRTGSDYYYPPSAMTFASIHPVTNIPANTWTTLEGKWMADQDYGICYLNIRTNAAMTIKVDEIDVKVENILGLTNIDTEIEGKHAIFDLDFGGPVDLDSVEGACKIDDEAANVQSVTQLGDEVRVVVELPEEETEYTFTIGNILSVDGKTVGKLSDDVENTVTFTTTTVRKVATPTSSVASGTVVDGTKFELSTETEGATIYYTTDGSAPTKDSTVYDGELCFIYNPASSNQFTLKVVALKTGATDSDVATYTYTIEKLYDYTITSLQLKNGNDEVIEEMPESGKVYVEISVVKNTTRNVKDTLVIASYDENGALVDMTYMRGVYYKNQEVTFGTLMDVTNVSKIKAFVWKSLADITPLSKVVEL